MMLKEATKIKATKKKSGLFIKRAKEHYGLKISARQENNLDYTLRKLHGMVKIDSYIGL